MKTKIFLVLNILLIASAAVAIVWQLFFAEEPNVRLIARAAVLLIVYLLAAFGIRVKRSPLDYMIYEEKYKAYLGEAFRTDKKSYRKLMKALTRYNEDKPDEAIAILDKLYTSCAEADDYAAVMFFKALCLEEKQRLEEAASCYEEVLTYNRSHATAWSNLGLIYQKLGRGEESFRAYRNAVTYDPENAYAYNNLASYYVKNGEAELGL
ncbi:MAG: tetratricopeptide repeat protein [Ruminococcus sp.]|nr:tetratricopeptide repeat protein [Ruminococcus sp.]